MAATEGKGVVKTQSQIANLKARIAELESEGKDATLFKSALESLEAVKARLEQDRKNRKAHSAPAHRIATCPRCMESVSLKRGAGGVEVREHHGQSRNVVLVHEGCMYPTDELIVDRDGAKR